MLHCIIAENVLRYMVGNPLLSTFSSSQNEAFNSFSYPTIIIVGHDDLRSLLHLQCAMKDMNQSCLQ